MSLVESGTTSQEETCESRYPKGWAPALNIKPHHVLQSLSTRNAIVGKDPKINSIFKDFSSLQRKDSSGYGKDVVGENEDGIHEFLRLSEPFLTSLKELPDDAVIHIDLKPDGMCNACAMGNHCMATNYNETLLFPAENPIKTEQRLVSKIYNSLQKLGFEEERDFIFTPTSHIMYDFRGKGFKDVESLQTVEVEFNSMLVKAGALRSSMRSKKL